MDRRLFLTLASGLLTTPRPMLAWPAVMPLRRLLLVNAHTGETFSGPYRDDTGPIAMAMEDLSAFLRDHYSGETIAYDVAAIDFLAAVNFARKPARSTSLPLRYTFEIRRTKPASKKPSHE